MNSCSLVYSRMLPSAVMLNKIRFYKYTADKFSASCIWWYPMKWEVQLHCPLPVGHLDLTLLLCKMPGRTGRSTIGGFGFFFHVRRCRHKIRSIFSVSCDRYWSGFLVSVFVDINILIQTISVNSRSSAVGSPRFTLWHFLIRKPVK